METTTNIEISYSSKMLALAFFYESNIKYNEIKTNMNKNKLMENEKISEEICIIYKMSPFHLVLRNLVILSKAMLKFLTYKCILFIYLFF